MRLLKAGVEAAMVPNPFRHHLRVAGGGQCDAEACAPAAGSRAWSRSASGQGERHEVEGNGRKLVLTLQARGRASRARWRSACGRWARRSGWRATRDGAPLVRPRTSHRRARASTRRRCRCSLPEIETVGDEKERLATDIFAPPTDEKPGLHVWLTMVARPAA